MLPTIIRFSFSLLRQNSLLCCLRSCRSASFLLRLSSSLSSSRSFSFSSRRASNSCLLISSCMRRKDELSMSLAGYEKRCGLPMALSIGGSLRWRLFRFLLNSSAYFSNLLSMSFWMAQLLALYFSMTPSHTFTPSNPKGYFCLKQLALSMSTCLLLVSICSSSMRLMVICSFSRLPYCSFFPLPCLSRESTLIFSRLTESSLVGATVRGDICVFLFLCRVCWSSSAYLFLIFLLSYYRFIYIKYYSWKKGSKQQVLD